MAKHFPGHKTEEYRRMLGKFGVSGDLALQQVKILVTWENTIEDPPSTILDHSNGNF